VAEANEGPHASVRAKLILAALALALSLAAVEGALRVLWQPPPKFMAAQMAGTGLFVPDPDLGWRMAPDFSMEFRWFWGDRSTIRTNSMGFRDIEHERERSPDVPRVVVLGDSHAFGYGVEGEEMFTSVLRPLLPSMQVLNLAETGYNTRQARELFQRCGAELRPDVVVLAFCQNDVAAQVIPGDDTVTAKGDGDSWLMRSSYLLQFLRDRVNSNRGLVKLCVSLGVKEELGGYDMLDPNIRPSLRTYPESLEREWQQTCEEVRRLRDACATAGASLVLVSIPSVQSVDPRRMERSLTYLDYTPADFEAEKPYRLLAELCARERIPLLDARPAFVESLRHGKLPFFEHDLHINAEGHRIVAGLLAPELRRMLAGK
jgi:lysophospholipase L1-like esterase